jgi:hypothetical protein
MPNADKTQPTTPTDESDSDRFNPVSPLLHPAEDEDELREGETILTFIAPPPEVRSSE